MTLMTRRPPINRRVTFSKSSDNARSESSIAVNPRNPYNIVAASKRFTDPSKYEFSLAIYTTFDGGETWTEFEPQLKKGWAGVSDPALAWDVSQDNKDIVYLVALPFTPDPGPILGIAIYQSTDGGRNWGGPNMIHDSVDPKANRVDDKQWAVGDTNPSSPYFGNAYAAWDDGPGVGFSNLAFARTVDHGSSWIGTKDQSGTKDQPAGSDLPGIEDSGAPELSVASDGTIYIVWLGNDDRDVKFVKSTNGGDSFTGPMVVAKGIVPLTYPFIERTHGWDHFAGSTFRVGTYCTGCACAGDNVVFAWADYREGISRIYYRRSTDAGNTWEGSASGQPLLSENILSGTDQHDFHPQLISTPSGEIGCAFYELGPKGRAGFPPVLENHLIDVILAVSLDDGKTFSERVTVTDYPWDPSVDAPLSHGDPDVTFIGEYFGLDSSVLGFYPLWTDTRTGIQEIFTARINEFPIRLSGANPATIPNLGRD